MAMEMEAAAACIRIQLDLRDYVTFKFKLHLLDRSKDEEEVVL